MKKFISILLILAMLCALFVSCGKKSEKEPDDTGAAEDTETNDYSDFNYSDPLNDDGTFKDIRALDYVTLAPYPVKIPTDISTVSDEDIQAEIDELLESYAAPEQITDRAVVHGDTLNIDYVGKVDGVEFSGGSTEGEGTDVTIGVTNYIDDFLEQLIGHMSGETFDIEVTFPEDYDTKTEDSLNGKDAVFTVTINYIEGDDVTPELTDAFVVEKFSENRGWNTVDDLKSSVRDSLFENNISAYVQSYMVDLSEFGEVPTAVYEYQVGCMVDYYQQMSSYYSTDIETMLGMTVEELVAECEDDLMESAKFTLAIQAICEENEDLKPTEQDLEDYYMENFGSTDYSASLELYGAPYLNFVVMTNNVVNYLIDTVTYEDPNVVLPAEDAE